MQVIVDFHIHSKYSRAVSKQMDLENIAKWAKIKGIDIVGTGDFTHPVWFQEIKEKLVEDGSGLLRFKKDVIANCQQTVKQSFNDGLPRLTTRNDDVRFILTSEISSIYKQGGKCRKIHTLIVAPNIETVEKINVELAKIGNIRSDGRPILGLPVKELAKLVWKINEDCLIIPAHIWTPWFSMFGSKSGFDSIKECFEELSDKIYAVETGLTSDPEMNWRLSQLDNVTLVSNSDAHSMQNLGREANVFELDEDKITFQEIADVLKTKDKKRFPYTIEFYPEEGKYHFDGHANCKFVVNPFETKYPNDRCPKCRRPMTIGAANRVEEIADRKVSKKLSNFPDSKHIVPLREIIAESFGVGVQSKKVNLMYLELIEKFGPEFKILLELDQNFLDTNFPSRIALGIKNVRSGNIKIDPGYDGIFGKVRIFKD